MRLSDVARLELGAQTYNLEGRFNGRPAAILALYQLPGSNALEAATGAKKVMAKLKESFPGDLDYEIALDTTLSITEGIKEIVETLFISIFLVIIVVFVFLQGWRATLIPIVAVPVSLIGTFAFFPVIGFSINPIALMGLVVAIGLVVDDAIVVVEAVQRHIEKGMPPKEAALKAMEEVAAPVVAIALVLAAVFLPTVFIPGITGRLYTQFAVTIAISVLLSAFNALTLSPALCSILLRPKKETRGPLNRFYKAFNNMLGHATEGYVSVSRGLIRKAVIGFVILAVMTIGIWLVGGRVPGGFLPEEDQGYIYRPLSTSRCCLASTYLGGRQAGRADHQEHSRRGILHYSYRLQSLKLGTKHLQRLCLHHTQGLVPKAASRREGVGHRRPTQPRIKPTAAGNCIRLSTAGNPGNWYCGRCNLYSRRPCGQRHTGSWRTTPGNSLKRHRSGPSSRRYLQPFCQTCHSILLTWTATKC